MFIRQMLPYFRQEVSKLRNKKNNKKSRERGASLIEALISIGLLSFVIVSILGGFSQQQANTRSTSARNIAIRLAEMRLEDLLKFPTTQLTEETFIDYVIAKENGFQFYDTDPNMQQQYRRTTRIQMDMLGQIATLEVNVDFPMNGTTYPFNVTMRTKRGVK